MQLLFDLSDQLNQPFIAPTYKLELLVAAFTIGFSAIYAALNRTATLVIDHQKKQINFRLLGAAFVFSLGMVCLSYITFLSLDLGESRFFKLEYFPVVLLFLSFIVYLELKAHIAGADDCKQALMAGILVSVTSLFLNTIIVISAESHLQVVTTASIVAALAHIFLITAALNIFPVLIRITGNPNLRRYAHIIRPAVITVMFIMANLILFSSINTLETPDTATPIAVAVHESPLFLFFAGITVTAATALLALDYYAQFISNKLDQIPFREGTSAFSQLLWPTFNSIASFILLIACLLLYVQWVLAKAEIARLSELEAQGAARMIHNEFSEVLRDFHLVNSTVALEPLFLPATLPQARVDFSRYFSGFLQSSGRYDSIRLLDMNGHELARVNFNSGYSAAVGIHNLQASAEASMLEKTTHLAEGSFYISPLHLSTENGAVEEPYKPVLDFAAPVFNLRGNRIGTLVLTYRFDHLYNNILKQVLSDFEGIALLLDQQGSHVLVNFQEQHGWKHLHPAIKPLRLDALFAESHTSIHKKSVNAHMLEGADGIYSTDHLPQETSLAANAPLPGWQIIVRYDYPQITIPPLSLLAYIAILSIGFAVAWFLANFVLMRIKHAAKVQTLMSEISYQKEALDEHAIVSMTNATGEIMYANDKFCEISGYRREELLGQNHRLLKSGEHPPEFYRTLWQTISCGNIWRGEIKNQRKDGSAYWVRATILPILNNRGKPISYIAVRTDISENKETTQALEKALQHARAAAESKNQFLANISHEIRTPMNAIIGLTDACLTVPDRDNQLELISKVNKSAYNLLAIINSILDFSKLEAGKVELEAIPFSLEAILDEYVLIHFDRANEKHVELLVDWEADMEDRLIGDPLRIGQVLSNLVSNAIKFTEHGEVLVTITQTPLGNDKYQVTFTVEDTGIGISADQLDHLFDAFSQADASTTRRYGGTGLGLAICRNLINLMNGEIDVKSRLNQGSSFTFSIPLQLDHPTDQRPPLALAEEALVAVIVEAKALAGSTYQHYLESFGFNSTRLSAEHELEIYLANGKRADLILIDGDSLSMAAADYLKQLETRFPHLRQYRQIILLENARNTSSACPQVEGVHCIQKPITASSLYNLLQHSAEAPEATATVSPAQSDSLDSLSVLVAEDNEINRLVIGEILKHWGISPVIVHNGREAVDRVQTQAFDLVLMDIQMPVLDGYQATRAIRALGQAYLDLPIYALTANSMEQDIEQAYQATMQGHIAKPIDREQLYQVLAAVNNQKNPPSLNHPQPDPSTPQPDTRSSINLKQAQQRLGIAEAAFISILQTYQRNYRGYIEKIENSLANSDAAGLLQVAHNVKGVAASLGAQMTSERAKTIELAAKQGNIQRGETAQLITNLHTLSSEIEQYIQHAEQAQKTTTAPVENSTDALPRQLLELRALVESFDTEATQTLQVIMRANPDHPIRPMLSKIHNALDEYDFETAFHYLQQIDLVDD